MQTEDQQIHIAVSPGELLDKISILQIKEERMQDEAKLRNVRHELGLLVAMRAQLALSDNVTELERRLKEINEQLWEIEDDIRELEARKDFGQDFIKLARAVYMTNDERAKVKKEINILLGSAVMEEKSYKDYSQG